MKLYPNILWYFFIWLVAVLLIFYFGFYNFPHSDKFTSDFLQSLSNWDGRHYIGIAQEGYKVNFQYAFFPLYPLLIKLFAYFTQNYIIAGVIISLGASFLGLNLFYKLVSLEFDKKIAEKTVLALLIFPTSFYFLTVYSEGLFFLLVVATFYLYKKGNLLMATLLAILCTATRLAGLAVVLALIYEIRTTSGFNRKNWYIMLAPLGFLAYCLFLWRNTGDPLYFVEAQLHWQRNLSIPAASFWETIRNLSTPDFITAHFNTFLDLLFAIFGTGLILRSFRFLPSIYSVYALGSIIFPLFTPSLSSMPRFLLVIFPIFILIALIRNKFVLFAYQLISILLLSAFALLFINGYWVS